MSNSKSHNTVRWLMESAIMIAIGTMLSEFPKIDFPLGGGLTICSMLPLVLISWRYGVGRGLIAAAAYSLLQLVLGLNNVQYATSALMAAGIVLLDYVIPYTLIGLAGMFRGKAKGPRLGLVLGIVLFIVAPAAITNLIVGEYDDHTLAWNIVDGILRVAVFVFYIWLIGRMEDIRRMFMYHGAEHKAIHCFEHGLPMTPENARQFPRLHVRCGTAFLIMVMVIAILVYTIFPLNAIISGFGVPDGLPKLVLVIVARIVLMPVIAGISYEITVKWAGSHPDNPLVKVILWPGMQMQYLTTHEPDDSQMECAIAAMQTVLAREDAEAAKAAKAPSAA